MIDKAPSRDTLPLALCLMGFSEAERTEIIASCARMAARGEAIDVVGLVERLIEEDAVATLGLLAGRAFDV